MLAWRVYKGNSLHAPYRAHLILNGKPMCGYVRNRTPGPVLLQEDPKIPKCKICASRGVK
jgi:hypothetical protein